MGSYHSYVGDAKLEDSKDNWYRISGLNISRWNVSPVFSNWSTGRTNEYSLFSNDVGYLGNNKSVWSYCYSKILNYTTNPFSSYNTWSMIIPAGRTFTIKDRSIYDGKTIASTDTGECGKNIYIGTNSGNTTLGIYSVFVTAANNIASSGEYPPTATVKFRPILTLKPIGDPEGTVLYCEVTAKLITQPYGYDRTIKFKPLYSKYNITKVELVLNIDENGNYNTKGSTGTFGADVLAGIVPPKNDETICIEFKTVNQKASGNAYTLKISLNNGKVLYLQDALIRTGNSITDVTNVRYDIYRENKLK